MIELVEVYKVYPGWRGQEVVALNGIDLTIVDKDIHGIVGESGAGKSTLIRCLTALERPTSGAILVDGQNLADLPPSQLRDARRRIGMVFQGGNLLDARTAADNIALPLRLAGWSRQRIHKRVQELLEIVGLADRGSSYPSQLSGGQRQRVGIARALADNPSVLLCDEPTSALDTETTEQILDLLKSVRDSFGVTVLIITHEMSVVRRICDSVTLLERGRIAATGSVSDILADTRSDLFRKIIPAPALDRKAPPGFAIIDVAFASPHDQALETRILLAAAELGATVDAGSFETIGSMQVARMALTVRDLDVDSALEALTAAGTQAEVRV